MTYHVFLYDKEEFDGFNTRVVAREVFQHERMSACHAWMLDNYDVIGFEADEGNNAADGAACHKGTKELFTFTVEPEQEQST